MTPPSNRRRPPQTGSPVGEGMIWASRIIAIGLAMFLPGVAGGWLDDRFGLRLLGPTGLILGFAAALYFLAQIAARPRE